MSSLTIMFSLNNTQIEIKTMKQLIELDIIKPHIQRVIDSTKVQDIIQFQLDFFKEHGYFNFTASGPINIHHFDQKYYLVDGQHRFEALEKLFQQHSHNIKVYILLVSVSSLEQIEFNYNMINKNTPLPDFFCFSSLNKQTPETVASFFQNKYPSIWSKSSRARRPHIYFNFFQESLAFICEQLNIDSSHKLQQLVVTYNKKLSSWDISSFKNINDNVYRKAHETGLYLGLFTHQNEDYGYEWAKKIVEEQTGKIIKKFSSSSKTKIPKKIKNDSWDKYIGSNVGDSICLCCRTTSINSKSFIGGHIISEKNGGLVTVDNIVPICSECNLSMGVTNMDVFINKYYPNNLNKFTNRDYKINNWTLF